jgi:hypothetical protein
MDTFIPDLTEQDVDNLFAELFQDDQNLDDFLNMPTLDEDYEMPQQPHDVFQYQPQQQDMFQYQPQQPQEMFQYEPQQQQEMLQYEQEMPQQQDITADVYRIKRLLGNFSHQDDEYITNADLSIIHNCIYQFTDDELWLLPNTWMRGTGTVAIKAARENMLIIKMLALDHNLSLRDILIKRFCQEDWVKCQCQNATGKRKGAQCERERRPGQLSCSRHLDVSTKKCDMLKYFM